MIRVDVLRDHKRGWESGWMVGFSPSQPGAPFYNGPGVAYVLFDDDIYGGVASCGTLNIRPAGQKRKPSLLARLRKM